MILKEPSKEDLRNVLYTLADFDEYFDKVYIDSTNLYLSQNILKLAKPEKLDFYLDIFSLNNYKELIDFIFLPPGPMKYSFPIIFSPMIGISSAKKAKSATKIPSIVIFFIIIII